MKTAVTALFKSYDQAKLAVKELALENLASSDISLLCPHGKRESMEASLELSPTGIPTPPIMEGLQGYLVKMQPLKVRDLGIVHIGGPLASQIASGANADFGETLEHLGVSADLVEKYRTEVKKGHLFFSTTTDSRKASAVVNTLSSYGGKDINKWNKNVEHGFKVTKSP